MTKLKQFIDEHDVTQRRIAKAIGIHESTLSNYVSGYHTPDDEMQDRIVMALRERTGEALTKADLWPAQPAESK